MSYELILRNIIRYRRDHDWIEQLIDHRTEQDDIAELQQANNEKSRIIMSLRQRVDSLENIVLTLHDNMEKLNEKLKKLDTKVDETAIDLSIVETCLFDEI